jgi:ESCRT-I complex subunit TSG101
VFAKAAGPFEGMFLRQYCLVAALYSRNKLHLQSPVLYCEEELRKCERIDEEMTAELQSLNESQEINPEDIITPSNPIYKQIFTHHNKEQAIEDAIYFLNKALLRGSIDAETFLRTVRQLSRTQFEHKTIVIKARKRANLA